MISKEMRNHFEYVLKHSYKGDLILKYITELENENRSLKEENKALNEQVQHLEKAYDVALKDYDNQIDVLRCDKCELYHEDCTNESCVEHYKKMIEDYLKEQENGQ